MPAPIIVGGSVVALGISSMAALGGANAFLMSARSEAQSEFNTRFTDVTNSTQRALMLDAFTHMYTSGKLVQNSSQIFSRLLGDLNEYSRRGNTAEEQNKDFWNNDLGRQLGSVSASTSDLANSIEAAIRGGDAIIDADIDPRNFSQNPLVLDNYALSQITNIDPADLTNIGPENTGNDSFTDAVVEANSSTVNSIGSWYNNLLNTFGVEISGWWDPLVIDLDGDGVAADFLDIQNGVSPVYFDLDANGFAEATTWHADGMLVHDLNGNGLIDNGNELFGNNVIDGFSALAAFDNDANGTIDANDTIWSDLQIWHDANSDGLTQSGELLTLASQDIIGIDLAASQPLNVPNVLLMGTATTSTGTVEVADYNFLRGSLNTRYAEDYNFDVRATFLPTFRGYGQMADMHIALSLDNDETNPASLMAIMTNIASYTPTEMFENYATIENKIEELLYRWAGVDGIDPASRGEFIEDARQLEFMEQLFGEQFVNQNEWTDNPGTVQADGLEGLWNDVIFARYKATILTQLIGDDLFTNAPQLDFAGDILDINAQTRLFSQDTLDDLEAAAIALPDTAARQEFWMGVADYLRSVHAHDGTGDDFGLDTVEAAKLSAAISSSDAALAWGEAAHDPSNGVTSIEYRYFNPTGETIEGDANGNTLVGGNNDDVLIGLAGADTIQGGDGNDTIFGHQDGGLGDDAAADTLEGGAGDDVIDGGAGHDIIVGETGADHLIGGDGNDRLGDGLGIANQRTQNLLDGGAGDDTYFVQGSTDGQNGIDQVFIQDSEGEDYLRFGSDARYPSAEFNHFDLGSIVRIGNEGIRITGQQGSLGYDVVIADQLTDLNDQDGVGIEWIRVKDTSNSSSWYNLKDHLLNWSTTMTTQGSDNGEVIYGIDFGNFEDSITALGGDDTVYAGAGNDVIGGNDGHDTLFGGAGLDNILGGAGNDIIDGGEGNDTISGGDGDDTITGGSGNDIIQGGSGANILDGGDGDDRITGGADQETYVLSGGTDMFINDFSGYELVEIPEGLLPQDVQFTVSGRDFLLTTAGTAMSGTTTIANHFYDPYTQNTFEEFHFDDGFSLVETSGSSWRWVSDTNQNQSSDETILFTSGGGRLILADGGTDRIYSGSGDATLSGGADDDFLYGQGGNNKLHGGTGDDYLESGTGDDQICGSHGVDTVSFVNSSNGVVVDLQAGTAIGEGTDTLFTVENVIGSSSVDTLYGDDQSNVLSGGLGDDTLDGKGGTDTADYSVNTAAVNVELKNGRADERRDGSWDDNLTNIENIRATDFSDRVVGDDFSNVIHAGESSDIINGGLGSDTLHGEGGNDALYGEHGNDFLYGGAGSDNLDGDRYNLSAADSGDDVIFGGSGSDNIWGRYGDDTLYGEDGNDFLRGNQGNDTLYGGAGNDKLYGHDGDDTLWGGLDHDDLWGGAGADTFGFADTLIFDEIHDFSISEGDKLDISNIVTGFDPNSDVLTDFFKIGFNGTHSYAQVDSNGGADGFDQIIKFVNTQVDETDFTVGVNLII
ncbi:calcium-binding protein [Actibacterium sp. 188UL27-1]|uniref:calcium-binding protein n=1 Tax=Actibacterium sp. 188UL27-1 TaxID=2786961 RepID=UPI001959510E|nr:calcium-binding protein [Actibacterium sp. 188UL27-1]MBM7069943.1 type I secretion C-terminal target domain-containing protein [Actibacterium sp. 188UL27-1]